MTKSPHRNVVLWLTLGFAGSVIALIANLASGHLHRVEVAELERRLTHTRDYCAAVSAALAMDARELESLNLERRAEASERFGSNVTYHSEPEILLCAKTPPDLTTRDQCWVNHDYACLAKLARAAAESTRP